MLKVSKIPSGTSADALQFFFENTGKYGGGDVENVQLDEDTQTAIITFEESEAVDVVLKKKPIKFKKHVLEVEAYKPNDEEKSSEKWSVEDRTKLQPSASEVCTLDSTTSEDDDEMLKGSDFHSENLQIETPTEPTSLERSHDKTESKGCDRVTTIKQLVKRHSLEKYLDRKITLQDARSMQFNALPLIKENLPWLLLVKLIMVNKNAREEDLVKFEEQYEEEIELNPMDLFLLTFMFCDSILQQEIILKLLKCRLAIPFIFRDYNNKLRWSKLAMKKILVPEHTATDVKIVDALLHKGKIVSFVKIGDVSVSKSKLLNMIMGEDSYPTFYNVECPLGKTKRQIANGTIESSWYFPKDDRSGLFNETIMFLNLRGDATKNSVEFNKILQLSNIVVVLAKEEHINDIKTDHKLISKDTFLIYALEANYKERQFEENVNKKLSTLNRVFFNLGSSSSKHAKSIFDVAMKLRKLLTDVLETRTAARLVDNLHVLQEKDDDCFNEEENLANDFKAVLEKHPDGERNLFVPIQGVLWHNYSTDYKAIYKSKTIDKKRELEENMLSIRMQQVQQLKSGISPLMKLFCKQMETICDWSQTEFSIYIEWIMSYIDDRNRRILPQRTEDYKKCWKKLKEAQDEQKNSDCEVLKKQLSQSEEILKSGSFGLEHLIRELGQMFEATPHAELNSIFNRSKFVEFACKLIQYGYPFEIMDGDTAMIPLTWVEAVLQRLVDVIGDEQILAISVLGVQSSGKSTLLNAMFGLKFPVSAGRCTRGVYIQLLKVDNKKLPFSYILVIDTEGLRAHDQDDHMYLHDNELATFVIGLGNITIINIKGENATELEDVLQIAVHALLRLKMVNNQINMNHTCIFTHQNVPASNAKAANIHGRQRMVDKLDKMTTEAANQEGLMDVTRFNQVLELDPDSHVFYLSDLFMGDPPMAPINIGYSKKVEKVRNHLINNIALTKTMFLKMSETISTIRDFWRGILAEDFVFSFRNSLEIKAYNLMETEFFKLKSFMDDFFYTFLREEARRKLISCPNHEQLEKRANALTLELKDLLSKKQRDAVKRWNYFVDNCSLKDIMEQWRENRHIKILEHEKNLQDEIKKKIDEINQECSGNFVREQKRKHHEREIKERAMNLAKQNKGKEMSSDELDEIFQNMWDEWLANVELEEDKTPGRQLSVKEEVDNILTERFSTDLQLVRHEQVFNDKLHDSNFSRADQLAENFSFTHITTGDIEHVRPPRHMIEKGMKRIAEFVHVVYPTTLETVIRDAITELNVFFLTLNTYIRKIQKADGIRFDKGYVTPIFDQLSDYVEANNKEYGKTRNFYITKKFKVKLAVFIARYISNEFTLLDETFEKNNSKKAHMSKYEVTLKQQFLGIVKEESETITLAKSLGSSLEELCIKDFEKQLPYRVTNIIKGEKLVTKHHLIIEMMKELAEKGNFDEYIKFIRIPKEFAIDWVKNLAEKELLSTKDRKMSRYSSLTETMVNSHIDNILECLNYACDVTKSSSGDAKSWIKAFQQKLSTKFELPPDSFDYFEDYKTVKDYMGVADNLKVLIDTMKESLISHFDIKDGRFRPWKENPFFFIIKTIWGCDEICPFCSEICQRTEVNHIDRHKCLQHRPKAVKGVHMSDTKIFVSMTCHEEVASSVRFSHNSFCAKANKCSCEYKGKLTSDKLHFCKDFANYFPDWDIEPNPGMESSLYWKWFTYRFRNELEEFYGHEMDKSIRKWKNITIDDAIGSLKR